VATRAAEINPSTPEEGTHGKPCETTEHTIWLGDINLHHPLWDKECNSHLFTRGNLEKSQLLIDVLVSLTFRWCTQRCADAAGLVTGNHTRPDNVFVSSLLVGRLVRCVNAPRREASQVDHIPGVLMEVDLSLEER